MDNIELLLVYLWRHTDLQRAHFGGNVSVFVRPSAGHHITVERMYLPNWVSITP